ncbi:MAG: hypothetical protein ACK5N8_06335 [Alphaproteobacteria bacterium]
MKFLEAIVIELRYSKSKRLLFCSLFLLSACGLSHRNQALVINNAMINGDYEKVLSETLETPNCEKIDIDYEDITLLNSLNGGTSLFLLQRYDYASPVFDVADQDMSKFFEQNIAQSSGKATLETLGNASILDYQPTMMDAIYVSSYKILSALGNEDIDAARIEVNKAYEKQKEAANYFSSEIEKAQKGMKEEAQNLDTENRENLKDTTGSIINQNFADLQIWNGYKDYMNPYTTYLSGLFFMTNGRSRGDFESASTYLKRVAGMSPNNSFIKNDLKQAETSANYGSSSKDKFVWVIYENGMVADFDEIRIDFPAFIVSNQVSMLSFSMPKPRLRDQAFPNISASFSAKSKVSTEILADVDNMMIAEYNKKLPLIIAKSTTKTIANAVFQYQMSRQMGAWGNLAATAYTITTSSADLRSWYILPKNVQLAKLKVEKNDTLELYVQNSTKIADVKIPTNQNSIVYVRIPSIMAKPIISVLKL